LQGTRRYNPGTLQWEFTGGDQGFWDVDLWIARLAERPLFDGPLGTTFKLHPARLRPATAGRRPVLPTSPGRPWACISATRSLRTSSASWWRAQTGLEHLGGEIFHHGPDGIFELGKNPDGTDAGTNDFFDAAIATITYPDLTEGVASGGHPHHRRQRWP